MNQQINIGWAQTDITPDRPIYVIGQLYSRISTYVHDPLTATCLVLENGEEQITFVSLDMPSCGSQWVKAVMDALDVPGLDVQKINFNATHTHNSTGFGVRKRHSTSIGLAWGDLMGHDLIEPLEEPEDLLDGPELMDFLVERVVALITDAWARRAPGGIALAQDYAAVGFNRRPVFALPDGSREARMYGNCSEDNFIGLEGYSDHTVDLLYTWDLAGQLTGVAVDVPSPSQVFELHSFISADYWGYARDQIREQLGQIYVLPFCGAAGDQNPLDLIQISKTNVEPLRVWNAQEEEAHRNIDMFAICSNIGNRIADAVSRGFKRARNQIETRPIFRYLSFSVDLPIRRVSEEDYREALAEIDALRQQYSPDNKMTDKDSTKLFLPAGVINRWHMQQEKAVHTVNVHVVRLSRTAFVTNPFELFVEFGLRIRARSKASQTFIIQLSNNHPGLGGYLPTKEAIAGGSYSSKPASTMVGPESGDLLTEETIAHIDKLFS